MAYAFNDDKSKADLDQIVRTNNNPNNIVTGNKSHAEGFSTTASGYSSHAEGSSTQALGSNSHAEGSSSIASSSASHAEGSQTHADGEYSHAEGRLTYATETCSHSEGFGTDARGIYSHAEGSQSEALGWASHAQNQGTKACGNSQTVIGKFNTPDSVIQTFTGDGVTATFNLQPTGKVVSITVNGSSEQYTFTQSNSNQVNISPLPPADSTIQIEVASEIYAFIIGNGEDRHNRSNAFAVKWDGTIVPNNINVMTNQDLVTGTSTTPMMISPKVLHDYIDSMLEVIANGSY